MNNDTKAKIAQLALPKNDINPPKNNMRLYGFGAVVILICLATVAFHNPNQSADQSSKLASKNVIAEKKPALEQQASNVSGAAPQPLPAIDADHKVLDASGYVVARRVATISSSVTGKVEKLLIEEGQIVNKNDVLAELDNRQANFSNEAAKASLQAVKASHSELLSQLKRAQIQYDRIQSLYEKKAVSKDTLENTALTLEQLQAKILNSKALTQEAEQHVKLSQYNLDQHVIRAPFAGKVIQKDAQVGELISAGMSGGGSIRTGIATIVDMNSLEIEVDIAEIYINRITIGQPVNAHLDAYPDWLIKGEVLAIIPTADRQKATIKARIKLLESDIRILPDMGIKVSFLENPKVVVER